MRCHRCYGEFALRPGYGGCECPSSYAAYGRGGNPAPRIVQKDEDEDEDEDEKESLLARIEALEKKLGI